MIQIARRRPHSGESEGSPIALADLRAGTTQASSTHKFISKIHTLTVADVNGATLTARHVSMDGAELDRFTITK
jgi:hypothetical protein